MGILDKIFGKSNENSELVDSNTPKVETQTANSTPEVVDSTDIESTLQEESIIANTETTL